MFTPRILKGASRELERLDPAVARRIVDRIRWLAGNIEHIKPEPLTGNTQTRGKSGRGNGSFQRQAITRTG